MTARTHDLSAFTALVIAGLNTPIPPMSLATAIAALGVNMLGGLFPDLDESTSEFWQKIRGGSLLSKLISPLMGGHRLITHSLLGLVLTGWLLKQVLAIAAPIILIDMQIIWWAFMLGHVSHLMADSLTKEGVPWLFPIPWNFGFPPFKWLRIKTGGIVEKSLVFPGLMLLNGYLIYNHNDVFLDIFKSLL